MPQSAGGRGRRRPHLRISRSAGFASGRGPRVGGARRALRERRMQLGSGGGPVCVVPESGGGGHGVESRRQKTEDRSQKSEDRRQKSEVRSQKSEDRTRPARLCRELGSQC